MFLTKKAFREAMLVRNSHAKSSADCVQDQLAFVDRRSIEFRAAQEGAVRILYDELKKRDAVLAENTRRINALMAFVGVTEHKVPATPETTVYTQEAP